VEEIARGLGIHPDQVVALLEPVAKNLTVGDVHVATALRDISVAYTQGDDEDQEDDDGDEAEDDGHGREAEDQARKSNENRDDEGRFASGDGSDKKTGFERVNTATLQMHLEADERPAEDEATTRMSRSIAEKN